MPSTAREVRNWSGKRRVAIALLLIASGGVIFGPRTAAVEPDVAGIARAIPTDLQALDAYVDRMEHAVLGVHDSTEKRIVWADGNSHPRTRTRLSVVYLHGFSATRQETAPLSERIADSLHANLVETRLKGHGLPGAALAGVTATDWLTDAVEAFAIGQRLGDSVVVVATSTGATLALWLAMLPPDQRQSLKSVVLISPNLGIKDPASRVLLWPWASSVLPIFIPTRRWSPRNAEQAKYWTTEYPSEALFPMAALVAYVRESDARRLTIPTLVFVNDGDNVVDARATAAFLDRATNAKLSRVEVQPRATEDAHVLVGRIVSPTQVTPFLNRTLAFLREP